MARETGGESRRDVQAPCAGRVYFLSLEPYSPNQDQTLEIASALVRDGWDARILCRAASFLAAGAAERSLPLHLFPAEGGMGPAMIWRLLRVIRGEEKKSAAPHLLHACDPSASRLASRAWWFSKSLRVVHTRRLPVMGPNRNSVRCYQKPQARIITDSLAGEIALRLSGIEPHLLQTVACGFTPCGRPAHTDRGDGRFAFALTGSLLPGCGHAELFAALPALEARADMPPWEVRILGDGPFFPDLLAAAREKNVESHLAFLGGVDCGSKLARCDALVLPASEGESYLPLILQGWAARIPVVTVNRLDHAEVLQDETNCLLFRPGDTEEMAGCMARLARDAALRERLVEGGSAALVGFGLEPMVAGYKRLYREVLA